MIDFAELSSCEAIEEPVQPHQCTSTNTLIIVAESIFRGTFDNVITAFTSHHSDINVVQLDASSDISTVKFHLRRAVRDAMVADTNGVICLVFCGHGAPARDGGMHGSMVLGASSGERQYLTQQALSRTLKGFNGMFILFLGACDSGAFNPLAANTEPTANQWKPTKHACKYVAVVACDEGVVVPPRVKNMLDAFAYCVRNCVKYKFLEAELASYWRRHKLDKLPPHCVGDRMVHGKLPHKAIDMVWHERCSIC